MGQPGLYDAVVNLGFATGAAAYLLWWTTRRLNSRLERVAEKLDEILAKEERILDRLDILIAGGGRRGGGEDRPREAG